MCLDREACRIRLFEEDGGGGMYKPGICHEADSISKFLAAPHHPPNPLPSQIGNSEVSQGLAELIA